MRYKPHDYQQQATKFILDHNEAAVLLGMGLGKSVISLTAIWELVLDYFTVTIAPCARAFSRWSLVPTATAMVRPSRWSHFASSTGHVSRATRRGAMTRTRVTVK